MWWTEMIVRKQGTDELATHANCAISTLPGIMTEIVRNTNGVQAAIETERNAIIDGQDRLLNFFTPRVIANAKPKGGNGGSNFLSRLLGSKRQLE
jgi:hypothetical protein